MSALSAAGATAIRSAASSALDGDNDGVGGDGYQLRFKVLYGDFNDDGLVSLADAVQVRNRIGTADAFADLDGNGDVDLADVAIARSRIGARLS